MVEVTYKVGKCLLLYHLKRKRMSQQELAEITGLTKQSISRYTKDAHIMSYENALNISKALGCQMEDLYQIKEWHSR